MDKITGMKELEKALSILEKNTTEWYYVNSLLNDVKARERKVKNKDISTVRDNLNKGYTATRFGTSEKAIKQLVEDLKTTIEQLNDIETEFTNRDIEFKIRDIERCSYGANINNNEFPLEVASVISTNNLL